MVFAKDIFGLNVYQIYVLVGNENVKFQKTLKDASVALNKKYHCNLPPPDDDMPYPMKITFEPYLELKGFVSLNLET